MHLPLKRMSSYKNTHIINIQNKKNFKTKQTYDTQLRKSANECTLHLTYCVTFMYMFATYI